MTTLPFSQLNLSPKVEKAISEMGFDVATPIQSEAIPLIRTGVDVIARSQTGTGKTIAFAIPAIEKVDTHEEKATIQVLILCPTRELAQQAAEEIRKVARFKPGIRPVEIYGGASIERQCIQLRRANLVIGTPGRVMDHMQRKTLKLSHLKMVVLDEADEMLRMGFKEDIETILKDTPEKKQIVLFSATMPSAILKLTQEFQKDPQLIEINKEEVTVGNIEQCYVDVPRNRKKDALITLLNYHEPNRAIIFSNTKKMVDELSDLLLSHHFSVESIHSDIKQSQRTAVMQRFKQGRTSILLATDIAARGIDVNDIDFVINFDLPINAEYYIHRIGRTGRAGKSGYSITLCSGRSEASAMRRIASDTKSSVERVLLPTIDELNKKENAKLLLTMEKALQGESQPKYTELVNLLTSLGYSAHNIAEAAMRLHFESPAFPSKLPTIKVQAEESPATEKPRASKRKEKPTHYETLLIDIGSIRNVTVNHIIGAVTERAGISGNDIGKVEIFPNQSVIEVPAGRSDEIIGAMIGCKITGKLVNTTQLSSSIKKRSALKTARTSKRAFRY